MKIAIIRSSALQTAGRWDAGFHILQEKHKVRVDELKEQFSYQEAKAIAQKMFEAVPSKHRNLLYDLLRGNELKSPSFVTLEKAVSEYPFITISVFESEKDLIEATINDQIKDIEDSKAKLTSALNDLNTLQ
jgi:hypothetical protein